MEKAKGKSCATCKWENEKLNPCVFCININSPLASEWEQKKPKTNADRIRAMTDKELATWLNCMQSNAYHCGEFGRTNAAYPYSNQDWFNWLKQEAADKDGEA